MLTDAIEILRRSYKDRNEVHRMLELMFGETVAPEKFEEAWGRTRRSR